MKRYQIDAVAVARAALSDARRARRQKANDTATFFLDMSADMVARARKELDKITAGIEAERGRK